MIVVLDASAAVDIIFNRKKAAEFKEVLEKADWVITPHLYISEVTNVFWKYHRFTDLNLNECETALEYVLSLPDEYINDIELSKEAFAMACQMNMPVYDMFYLICARRHNALFLTSDGSLKRVAKNQSIKVN